MRPGPHHPGTRAPRHGPPLGRRRLLGAASALAAMATVQPARATVAVAELALACDTTLGTALRAAGAAYQQRTGVRVNVFATDPGLILPQLERQVQNDIVVTQQSIMQAAVQAGVVAKNAIRGRWQDAIVIAGRRGESAATARSFAVCDPTPASDLDGPAILTRLGLMPGKTFGVINTDTVVALVLNGTAHAGLMHMTDVRAHPALQVLSIIPETVQPPIHYAAAVTALARRPHPARFIEFLHDSQATTLLASLGLESAS